MIISTTCFLGAVGGGGFLQNFFRQVYLPGFIKQKFQVTNNLIIYFDLFLIISF